MSRYFFHVLNGKAVFDTEGIDLPDLKAVRKEAVRSAGEMIRNDGHTWKGDAWQMVVSNEAEDIVFGVRVSVDRHGH